MEKASASKKFFLTKVFNVKKLFKLLLLFILLIIVLLYGVLPVAMGIYALLPADSLVGSPPSDFTEITLTTEDNVKLAAWYAPPSNGAVILVVPGSGDNRENVRNYIQFLHDAGYGVLAIDLRGFGESEGQSNRFGWSGNKDIKAAVNFLKSKEDVKSIGALGLSLGGEVLLGAVSENPEIKAVVAEGATYRCFDEFNYYEGISQTAKFFSSAKVMDLVIQILSGTKPPTPIMKSIRENDSTSYLFIAAGQKAEEIDFNTMYQKSVGDRGELWVIPEVGHIQGLSTHPEEYKQKVVEFFKKS